MHNTYCSSEAPCHERPEERLHDWVLVRKHGQWSLARSLVQRMLLVVLRLCLLGIELVKNLAMYCRVSCRCECHLTIAHNKV